MNSLEVNKKQLSFVRDKLIFSKQTKACSPALQVLANLEEWLSSSPLLYCKGSTYRVSVDPEDNNKKTLLLVESNAEYRSRPWRVILFLLKILATVLILPRLVAELIRFGLHRSFKMVLLCPTHLAHILPDFKIEIGDYNNQCCYKGYLRPVGTDKEINAINKKVQPLKDKIVRKEQDAEITYLPSSFRWICFELKSVPGVIFKVEKLLQYKTSVKDPYKENVYEKIWESHRGERLRETINQKGYCASILEAHNWPLCFPKTTLYTAKIKSDLEYIIEEKVLEVASDEATEDMNLFEDVLSQKAAMTWAENERAACPIFVKLIKFLMMTGISFEEPRQFPLVKKASDASLKMYVMDPQECTAVDIGSNALLPFQMASFFKNPIMLKEHVTAVLREGNLFGVLECLNTLEVLSALKQEMFNVIFSMGIKDEKIIERVEVAFEFRIQDIEGRSPTPFL